MYQIKCISYVCINYEEIFFKMIWFVYKIVYIAKIFIYKDIFYKYDEKDEKN